MRALKHGRNVPWVELLTVPLPTPLDVPHVFGDEAFAGHRGVGGYVAAVQDAAVADASCNVAGQDGVRSRRPWESSFF